MDRRGELIDQLTKTAVLRRMNAEHWERIADSQRKQIERLTAEVKRLQVHIASAPPPAVVHVNPDTYKAWYLRDPASTTENLND